MGLHTRLACAADGLCRVTVVIASVGPGQTGQTQKTQKTQKTQQTQQASQREDVPAPEKSVP
jgi:hypothetical protein